MAGVWSTHAVELLPDRVVKRYRQWGEQEHEREWRALTLLQTYAPGLSPVPLDLDTTSPTPTLVMSRVPGTVLRGGIVEPAQISALAELPRGLIRSPPGKCRRGMSRTGARLRPGMNAAALGRPYPAKEKGRPCNRTRSPMY